MGEWREIITKRGYKFSEVSSAMQKAIRRGDARLAGYWAIELYESGFSTYVWKRLYTISAEDCWGILTQEIQALHEGFGLVNEGKKEKGRIFISKAVILLSLAKKSRDADHLTNLVYDKVVGSAEEFEADIVSARKDGPPYTPIPGYAYDVHTQTGRRRGKTKEDFFRDEHAALKPRQSGLFDGLAEAL